VAASFRSVLYKTQSIETEERLLSIIVRKCLIQCGLSPHVESSTPHPASVPLISDTENAALSPFGKLGPQGAFIPGEDFPTH